MNEQLEASSQEGIALIGMAGRFSGAPDLETFWRNICAGLEAIKTIPPEEDSALKAQPGLRGDPNYVPVGAFVDGIDLFDPTFFGYTAQEAQILDPQHRLFLEHAWEVLEKAGYDVSRYQGRIGVYAGCGMNDYFQEHVRARKRLAASLGDFQMMLANSRDFLTTRIAYKLGLKGPAITIQTACSTSLVAVALACQSLFLYQCDIALAGGVSILHLEKEGYFYEQGGIASPDGHCRTFSAQAQGTVFGDGIGIVALKRLEDALADGDQIYAIIKGAAINNDGGEKAGFTAPGLNGQIEVITEALALAQVEAASIGYIEAHGTGTYIGDPIEVAALTQAFHSQTQQQGFCALGSVKTNIGHTDAAAGIAGLIKTVLALNVAVLPPSLHFDEPNPQIDFAQSPFYVNTSLKDWPAGPTPRRAGVSAFGIGGTNAHIILEEPPKSNTPVDTDQLQLIVLSAKTACALDTSAAKLATHVQAHPELTLADIAYTLQVGRKAFNHRRIAICQSSMEFHTQLEEPAPRGFSSVVEIGDRSLLFLFPGQGTQYLQMGMQLYEQEPTYRQWVDTCADHLLPFLGRDVRTLLFGVKEVTEEATRLLEQTQFAQAALFVTEYALAQLLETWGLKPTAMLGHSIGEYVAACLAGVFSLEQALFLVAERGRFMQSMPMGAMLAIPLPEHQVHELLDVSVSLSAINTLASCVVAGPEDAIQHLANKLTREGINHRRLHTSHAFHSPMMVPAVEPFLHACEQVVLCPPRIPFISCTTGSWITDEEATSPLYWAKHLREPVRFADGLCTALNQLGQVLLEVGPGQTLTTFTRQYKPQQAVFQSMRHPQETQHDRAVLLTMIGKLWLSGLDIDFARLHIQQNRRVLLPTYPFERHSYWLSRVPEKQTEQLEDAPLLISEDGVIVHSRPQMTSTYTPPRTATEQRVATIWQEVLGFAEIGIHDNFFELGGTSLLLLRLIRLLRITFHIDLLEGSIYEQQTIAALSHFIDANDQTLEQIQPVSRTLPQLASWHQQCHWRRDHLYPEQATYSHVTIGFELHGTLDKPLFEQAVNLLIAHHEILRTSFREVDGKLLQQVHPSGERAIPLIDLRHLPSDIQSREVLTHAEHLACMPFAMDCLPLWRLALFAIGSTLTACALIAHPAVWDGKTADRMIEEIGAIMSALKTSGKYTPAPLPLQYMDIAAWERTYFQGQRLQEHLQYWHKQLQIPLPAQSLPTDRLCTSDYAMSTVFQEDMPSSLSRQLKALSHAEGVSLYTLLLALVKLLCYGSTQQEEIAIDVYVSMRSHEEAMTIPGPLVNGLPLHTSLAGNPHFRELLYRVQETVLGALNHRTFPFARFLQEAFPELYISHKPTSQISMTLYETNDHLALPDLTVGRRLWFRRAVHDLYIGIIDHDDTLSMIWEYNPNLFDETTVQRILQNYLALAQHIVTDPSLPINEYVHNR